MRLLYQVTVVGIKDQINKMLELEIKCEVEILNKLNLYFFF